MKMIETANVPPLIRLLLWNHPYAEDIMEQMQLLIDSRTVDAVPVVHGRWIMRGGKRYCSECGEKACVTRDSDDYWYTVGTKYCPTCGTKMDGE